MLAHYKKFSMLIMLVYIELYLYSGGLMVVHVSE